MLKILVCKNFKKLKQYAVRKMIYLENDILEKGNTAQYIFSKSAKRAHACYVMK
jgi:hypothetical protein